MPTPFFADLVRELAQDGGTGPLTPTGAVPGHRRFADVVPADTMFHYAVSGIGQPGQWETGLGHIDASGRLVRDAVAASSAGGDRIDFAAGLKTIALTVGAGWFAASDAAAAATVEMLAAKQPLSTTHADAVGGAGDDRLTVRRGEGWVNLPLSALAWRDADGRYQIGGSVAAGGGTATVPAIGFAADGDTGLFRAASDCLGLATGGSERLRVDATGRIGIGTTTPGCLVHTKSSSEILRLETTTARGGGLCFQRFTDPMGSKGYVGFGSGVDTFHVVNQLNGAIMFGTNDVNRWTFAANGHFCPLTDNAYSLGVASTGRIKDVFLANSPTVTSDAREKAWRGTVTPAELAAARRIGNELGFYQWNDAIAEKGPGIARLHFGARAQAVWAIMADEGLIDPIEDGVVPSSRYAFLCYDEWEEDQGDADNVAIAAGNRFGVRPDQLALFLIAVQEQRLATLEAAA